MPDWMQQLFERLGALRLEDLQATDWLPMLLILLISCATSLALTLLYGLFFERRTTGTDIHRAFPALGVSITAIFVCLQFSLPLSLGLLGALSIVRFRTPIKEPEEIGFLMLLIATSICCATLNFLLLVMVLALAVVLMVTLRCVPWFARRRSALASLVVTVAPDRVGELVPELRRLTERWSRGATLDGISECGGSCVATLTLYRGDSAALTALQQQVRELISGGEVSLFVQRPLQL